MFVTFLKLLISGLPLVGMYLFKVNDDDIGQHFILDLNKYFLIMGRNSHIKGNLSKSPASKSLLFPTKCFLPLTFDTPPITSIHLSPPVPKCQVTVPLNNQ